MPDTDTDTDAGLAANRLLPTPTDLDRFFWTSGADGVLRILRCDDCGRWVHPPTASCPTCTGSLTPEPTSGAGTVFTFTVNRHPFNPSVPLPYVIALVVLAEQDDLRLTTNIVGCEPEQVEIGMPV